MPAKNAGPKWIKIIEIAMKENMQTENTYENHTIDDTVREKNTQVISK